MNRMHGIIFAYEQRGELRELTERRTAASMPFGGRYRAVDFALSNLLNAGVTDVLQRAGAAHFENVRGKRVGAVGMRVGVDPAAGGLDGRLDHVANRQGVCGRGH